MQSVQVNYSLVIRLRDNLVASLHFQEVKILKDMFVHLLVVYVLRTTISWQRSMCCLVLFVCFVPLRPSQQLWSWWNSQFT